MKLIGYDELVSLLQMVPADTPIADRLTQLANEARIVRFPYTYNAVFSAGIAAAGNATVNVAITADAPFLIVNSTYEADVAGSAVTASSYVYPLMSVLLTDTGSNRQMMDVAVPVTSIFGNGQFPYVWPEPKLMPANSVLQVQVTSFEAANTNRLRLSFNGYKLYSL